MRLGFHCFTAKKLTRIRKVILRSQEKERKQSGQNTVNANHTN